MRKFDSCTLCSCTLCAVVISCSILLILGKADNGCKDIPAPGSSFSCEQQVVLGLGCFRCIRRQAPHILPEDYCQDLQSQHCCPYALQRNALQLQFGKCNEPFMLLAPKDSGVSSYCASTCGRCSVQPSSTASGSTSVKGQESGCACYDAPASSNGSCAAQAARGECRAPYMLGTSPFDMHGPCSISCRTCPPRCLKVTEPVCPCSDVLPSALGVSCSRVVDKNMCHDTAIVAPNTGSQFGYCMASCRRCPCTDVPPPDSHFSCPEQAFFNKCSEPWMTAIASDAPKGYCQISCGRCRLQTECPQYYPSGALPPDSSAVCPSDSCPAPVEELAAVESAASPSVQYTLPPPGSFGQPARAGGPPPDIPGAQYNLPPPGTFGRGRGL